MYSPMVDMLVAAENATELPKLGRPRTKLKMHASHTVCVRSVVSVGGSLSTDRDIVRTGPHGRLVPFVHLAEERVSWDAAVPREGVHHAAV